MMVFPYLISLFGPMVGEANSVPKGCRFNPQDQEASSSTFPSLNIQELLGEAANLHCSGGFVHLQMG